MNLGFPAVGRRKSSPLHPLRPLSKIWGTLSHRGILLTFFNQCCTTDTASLSTTSTSCNKLISWCPHNTETHTFPPFSSSQHYKIFSLEVKLGFRGEKMPEKLPTYLPAPLTELTFGGKGNPVCFRARMYTIHVVMIIFGFMPILLCGSLLPLKLPQNSSGTKVLGGRWPPDWPANDDVTMTSFNLQGQSRDGKERSESVHLSDTTGQKWRDRGRRSGYEEDTRRKIPKSQTEIWGVAYGWPYSLEQCWSRKLLLSQKNKFVIKLPGSSRSLLKPCHRHVLFLPMGEKELIHPKNIKDGRAKFSKRTFSLF